MFTCFDPGHGGKDSGALGQRGTMEKDFTLDIAKRCAVYVTRLGHKAVLTRDKDIYVGLTERANIANIAKVDFFVSIHCNSANNRQAHGTEVFCCTGSIKGKVYATKVQNALIKVTKLRDRGVKEARYSVLRHTNAPAILVEVAFISNKEEELLLMQEEFRKKVAITIVNSILDKGVINISTATVTPQIGTVIASALNVREKPTVNSNKIGKFKRGDTVKIHRKYGEWYSIFYGNHGGYVCAKYVK